jgi:hypothetical protein
MNDDYVETLIGIKNYLVQHRRSLATEALVSAKQTGTRANELAAAIVTAQNLVEGVANAIAPLPSPSIREAVDLACDELRISIAASARKSPSSVREKGSTA